MEPLAISITAAATACGLGKTKFYEEIAAGRVKTVRVGSRQLCTAQSLRDYVALLEQEAAALVAQ
jgi:hypothetical protein